MQQRRTARRGVTAVETAAILGLLFLVLLGIMEYGRYVMFRHLVENAAREGVRYAVVHSQEANTGAIIDIVRDKLTDQVESPTITVNWINPGTGATMGNWFDAPYGDAIAVQVSTTYSPMVPTFGILPPSLTITARHVMRTEAH
jgi:Flp pilus assembly protein TadG